MIGGLFKAVAQLSDPRFQRIFVKMLLASVIVLVLLVGAVWVLLGLTNLVDVPPADQATGTLQWLWYVFLGLFDSLFAYVAGAGALILAILLFPAVAIAILGIWLDEAAEAVEDRYYPNLPPPRQQRIGEMIAVMLRFGLIALVLNILVLPLYLSVVLTPFVYYGLNGYLVGREFYEVAALRHLDPRAAGALRRENRARIFIGGVILTFLLSIPIVGLFVPVVAVAYMVHLFHGMRMRRA